MSGSQPEWLKELDAARNDAVKEETKKETPGFNDAGAAVHLKRSRNQKILESLDQEMKLLHWHKLANEAALKAALIRTKKLKEVDRSGVEAEARKEKEHWMQQIVEEERSKPLKVDEQFIRNYESRERHEEERLEVEVRRHIHSLKQLKTTLKTKEEERQRNLLYRKKKQLLQESFDRGDLQAMLNAGQRQTSTSERSVGQSQRAMTERTAQMKTGKQVHGTLSKVINSLDRLVDLETRISRLEADVGPTSPTAGRGYLTLKKHRTDTTLEAPGKTVFTVRVRSKTTDRTRSRSMPRSSRRRRGGSSRSRTRTRRRRLKGSSSSSRRGSGARNTSSLSSTFMTSLPEGGVGGSSSRRHGTTGSGVRRSGRRSRPSMGDDSISREQRLRVRREKRLKESDRSKRQDGIIKDWLHKKQKRKERSKRRVGGGSGGGRRTGRGSKKPLLGLAAQHESNFKDIKKMFEKRKLDMRRELMGSAGRGGEGSVPGSGERRRGRSRTSSWKRGTGHRSSSRPKMAWGASRTGGGTGRRSHLSGSRIGGGSRSTSSSSAGMLKVSHRTQAGSLVKAARSASHSRASSHRSSAGKGLPPIRRSRRRGGTGKRSQSQTRTHNTSGLSISGVGSRGRGGSNRPRQAWA